MGSGKAEKDGFQREGNAKPAPAPFLRQEDSGKNLLLLGNEFTKAR
jgi:hypothetical protein